MWIFGIIHEIRKPILFILNYLRLSYTVIFRVKIWAFINLFMNNIVLIHEYLMFNKKIVKIHLNFLFFKFIWNFIYTFITYKRMNCLIIIKKLKYIFLLLVFCCIHCKRLTYIFFLLVFHWIHCKRLTLTLNKYIFFLIAFLYVSCKRLTLTLYKYIFKFILNIIILINIFFIFWIYY
jgi:hypothetical protein